MAKKRKERVGPMKLTGYRDGRIAGGYTATFQIDGFVFVVTATENEDEMRSRATWRNPQGDNKTVPLYDFVSDPLGASAKEIATEAVKTFRQIITIHETPMEIVDVFREVNPD